MKTLAVNCEDKNLNLDRKQNALNYKSVKLRAKRSLSSNIILKPMQHFAAISFSCVIIQTFTHMKDSNFHHCFYSLNFGKSKVNAHLRPENIFKTSCFKNIKLQ